jgi:hypothetical protein
VVRGPERRVADQHPGGQDASGGGVHPGHRERLLGGQDGQQAGQALGQHGLARTRGAHHQQVVPAGGGHLEGVAPEGLSLDIGQIGDVGWRRGRRGGRDGRPHAPGAQDLRQLGQRRDAVRGRTPDQEGLAGIAQGHDQLQGCRGVRQRDHARDVAQRAVEPELAAEGQPRGAVRGELARGHQHPDGDGQVEPGAPFPDARRGEVHRHPAQRPGQPTREKGGPDPVTRLTHGGVGQAHNGEAGQPVGDVDLDRDRVAHGAGQRRGGNGSEHAEERSASRLVRRSLLGHSVPIARHA